MLLLNYYRLGQILIDKVAIGNGKVNQYQFKFERYPEFLQLLNSEQGVIMIGAHVGNWEIGVPFFDDYGKKINIVMYDAEHRRIKEILEKNGQDKEFKIIPVNEDNLTHVFRITEAINQKEYVCFQGTGKNLPFSFYNSGTGSTNKRKESGDGSARTIYCCFGTDTKTLSGTMVQLLSILGTCRKAVTGFKRETKRCNRINMTKSR